MKAFILVLLLLALGYQASAQSLQEETVQTILSEQLQCRYQLRNDGYSQLMPFTLEVKIVSVCGQRNLEVSLSSVSRFFSALNVVVRSAVGFETVSGSSMMRMQSSAEFGVNSKAEVMGRTIKLQVTDADGLDWRGVSCLRDSADTIVTGANNGLRNGI